MAHTKAPWKVIDEGEGYLTIETDKDVIATIFKPNDKERRENAHLIAAAPELLRALEGLVYFLDGHISQEIINGIKESIAKAKGGV